MARITNKFRVELLIDNCVSINARNRENILSKTVASLSEMFVIFRYVYILQNIVNRCLKNKDCILTPNWDKSKKK